MSKKGLAIFSLAYSPFVGGAEVAVKEISDRLPDFQFKLFTYRFDKNWKSQEQMGNVLVNRIGTGGEGSYYGQFFKKFLYIFQAWLAAEKSHKQNPFSATWAIMASYGGIAALLFKLFHPGIPLLLTLQEGDPEEHILKRVGIFYWFWSLIFKKADYVQVISNYLGEFAVRHGVDCPIEVVPNGVDLRAYEIHKSKPSRSNGPYTIITTSRLVHKNGVDVLIEAMKLVKRPAELLVLGDGPQRTALELQSRGIKVKFLGHIAPEVVPDYLIQADLFVRPARSEGLGSSFLEAMAAGLPIVGTPVGGISDFLTDGETGFFAKVDDPKDLASKIDLLLGDAKLRKRIAQNGKKLIGEKYSWDLIAGKINTIFKKIISGKRILIATGIYPPDIGGPATYSSLLKEELPNRGFKVGILTYGPAGISRNIIKGLRHILYFFSCLFRSISYDVIFAQDTVSSGLPALFAAKLMGKRFIIRVAGDHAWEQATQRFGVKDSIDNFQNRKYGFRTEFLRRVQKFVVRNSDLVITPSRYFQKLVSAWINNSEKVKVIYNGIRLENGKSEVQTGKPSSKTILSAGRLVPWKGFDALIETIKYLPGWKLIIVGDGPEKQNLESRILNLELGARVKLIGSVPREKLLELLKGASIFALNTSFESFSFQVVEAMAAGLPVITTNIGNLSEIIEHNKEGILVEPNNKEQIQTAIKKISDDKAFTEKIIKNARKKSQQFSIENTLNQLEQLLKSI